MTGCTIGSKAAIMLIILTVAGITIGRRALINTTLVAIFARDFGMLTFQLESRKAVVKLGRFPSVSRMAGTTIGTKARFVWVVRAVTKIAILWGGLEIGQLTRVNVALDTGRFTVASLQLELRNIVIESPTEPVYAIVTIKASCPKGQSMRLGKDGVHLTVASIA